MAKKTTKSSKKIEEFDQDLIVPEAEISEQTTNVRKDSDVDAIDIVNGERYVRQYSRAIHGDDFMELANKFCQKKPRMGTYTQVPAEQITEVEVRFREKEDADLPLDKQKPDAPMVDKVVRFSDKEAALRLGAMKTFATVVVRKRRA